MDTLEYELMLFEGLELKRIGQVEEELKKEQDKERGFPLYRRRKHQCSWTFYQKYHQGKASGTVYNLDPNLGHFLKKDGHLEKIQREGYEYFGQPLRKYWELYSNCNRNQLREKDSNLYRRMSINGQLLFVPKAKRINSKIDYGSQPLRYFWENHPTWTKKELRENCYALYVKMHRNEQLIFVPKAKRTKS